MKKLLVLLFSLFFLISPSVFADDISNFKIEGIGIGDSLLDYMTEDEILKEIELSISLNEYSYLKEPNKYITNKSKNEKYEILSVNGSIEFIEDFDGCLKERDVIAEVFSEMFPDAQKFEQIRASDAEPSGNSVLDFVYFDFDSGARITAYCKDYEETWRLKQNYTEGLSVNIQSKEIVNWLANTK